jgi:hypothetical protein
MNKGPENVHLVLAIWLVKRSNWLYIDATIVAPASFAIIEPLKKPELASNEAATYCLKYQAASSTL